MMTLNSKLSSRFCLKVKMAELQQVEIKHVQVLQTLIIFQLDRAIDKANQIKDLNLMQKVAKLVTCHKFELRTLANESLSRTCTPQ